MGLLRGALRHPQRAFVYCRGPCRTRVYYPGPDRPIEPQFCSDRCRQFAANLAAIDARRRSFEAPPSEAFLEAAMVRVHDAMRRTEEQYLELGDYAECAALLAVLQKRIAEVKK